MRKNNKLIYVIVLMLFALPLTSCGGGAKELVGEWVCLDDLSDWFVIEKTDNGYVFINDEVRYPAKYKGGMLRINFGLGEIQARYSKDTKELIMSFMGDESRYIPKSVLMMQVSSLIKKYRDALRETWADREPDRLKQYVTDSHYQDNILEVLDKLDFVDTTAIDYTMEIGEIDLYSEDSVHVTTRQNWHYRFKTNDGSIIPLNGKDEIEIKEEYECVYEVVRENGKWKIDYNENRWTHRWYLDDSGNWTEY